MLKRSPQQFGQRMPSKVMPSDTWENVKRDVKGYALMLRMASCPIKLARPIALRNTVSYFSLLRGIGSERRECYVYQIYAITCTCCKYRVPRRV